MNLTNLVAILLIINLLGCSSAAPKKDDYARYVKLNSQEVQFDVPVFQLIHPESVDVRGEYPNNDSIANNAILYQGGAGALGFLAQIATHAAINDSIRDDKLSTLQIEANKVLKPVSDIINQLKLTDVVGDIPAAYKLADDSAQQQENYRVKIKPIFFVAHEFEYIAVKSIVWIDKKNTKKQKKKSKKYPARNVHYQNLIEVVSRRYGEEELALIKTQSNGEFFISEISQLFQESLLVAAKELSGFYQDENKVQSYKLTRKSSNRYIRAHQVDMMCDKLVLRNLRSWLIVIPNEANTADRVANCQSGPLNNLQTGL